MDRESGVKYLFDKPGANEISNDLVRGMSREILSLQSISEKLRDTETSFNTKVADIKANLDNMHFMWRAINLALVVAVITWGAGAIWRSGE